MLILKWTGSLKEALSDFYANRALRILPVYSFYLIVLLLANQLKCAAWHFAGLFNFKLYQLGHFTDAAGHYWTLCVEEQFYLLFPLVFLLIPIRKRLSGLCGLYAASIVGCFLIFSILPKPFLPVISPIWATHFLCGAVFAQMDLTRPQARLDSLMLPAGLVGLAFWLFYTASHPQMTEGAWPIAIAGGASGYTAFVAESLSLLALKVTSLGMFIYGFWRMSNPILLALFSNPITTYLGQISYGLYVYHLGVLRYLVKPTSAVEIAMALVVTIVISAVSWQVLESLFSKMRLEISADRKQGPKLANRGYVVAGLLVALNLILTTACIFSNGLE